MDEEEIDFQYEKINEDQYRQNKTIFVGGIPDRIKETDLAGIFGTFGVIVNVYHPKDPVNGRQRGFAFIEYEDPEDVEHAIYNYDNTEIYGAVIRVKKAKHNKKKIDTSKAIWNVQYEVDEEI